MIDSGASFHISPRRECFATYTARDFGTVRMGNHQSCSVIGRGDVILETDMGAKITLKDVHHVMEIRMHLISTGALDDDGYHNHFGGGKWKLTKGSLVVARGVKQGSLYTMQERMRRLT